MTTLAIGAPLIALLLVGIYAYFEHWRIEAAKEHEATAAAVKASDESELVVARGLNDIVEVTLYTEAGNPVPLAGIWSPKKPSGGSGRARWHLMGLRIDHPAPPRRFNRPAPRQVGGVEVMKRR
jgi:hypothetical protein